VATGTIPGRGDPVFDYREVADLSAVEELAKSAFAILQPAHAGVDDWLRRSLDQGKKLYGTYEADRLLSVYMLYDYRMRLRRSIVPMGGIGLLCSRLDVRGRGAVRQMLRGALGTMRTAGHAVSVLDPFDPSFYRKYGWELFEQRQRIEMTPGLLDVPDDPEIEHEVVDLPTPDDASRAFYNDYARTHYTLVQRGDAEWSARTRIGSWRPTTAARGVVRVSRGGEVVGLIGYDLTGRMGDWHPTLTVNLLAAGDEPARREMLRYLRRLSHQVKTLRFDLPIGEPLWPYLADRPMKQEIADKYAIRIVDMERLDGLAVAADDLTIAIDVVDEQAPWNAGVWRWTIENETLRVERADQADLRCGIGPLSSILSGFTDFAEMIAVGRAEVLTTYAGQDLPRTTTFLADYF
jgi:predicted acetyltransferase